MAWLRSRVIKVGFREVEELGWNLKGRRGLGRGRVRQEMPGKRGQRLRSGQRQAPVPSVSSPFLPLLPSLSSVQPPFFPSLSSPYNRTER